MAVDLQLLPLRSSVVSVTAVEMFGEGECAFRPRWAASAAPL